LRSQNYFLLVELLGTREEEKFRSDNQEQEDIDGPGEVEHRETKKHSRRRYMVVTEP
jgi:hypothetical protein